ncbi:hypothetical protein [Pseudomonas sp. KNUC1026]|uniref:hypothetical protein n=1 Tax=Pseudomonas sp. KNUC1026 TaxID=2893890 RepID=UPI001F1BA1F1|nr:hypothetical protein [Pseudomonas sp. KNUC1026]UFH51013.1 hypothetical protein LN139_08110 [Pseudomonas sp. KNUC1026]
MKALTGWAIALAVSMGSAGHVMAAKQTKSPRILVNCTASAMEAGRGIELYKAWFDALDAYHRRQMPALSDNERHIYSLGEIDQSRTQLKASGMNPQSALREYYEANCSSYTFR